MKRLLLFITICFWLSNINAQTKDSIIQIVFTSDVHYGIVRKHFRGENNVPSYKVNEAMLKQINDLPNITLPNDEGVASNDKISFIDYLIITGDITNREEIPYQSATISWKQFEDNYIDHLKTKNSQGSKTTLLLTPGNHDASNAIGYYKPMQPKTDPTSMINIYNLMMDPDKPKTQSDFNYYSDVVNYSKNIDGIHCMFISIWPDSANIIWMEKDLKQVSESTPVLIFGHVPPAGDPKLFYNPNIPATINKKDRFENLLQEHFKDRIAKDKKLSDIIEQREFVAFLKNHPNIKGYFHGHENANEFYDYHGADDDISLPTFRVDSPMKGKVSSKDESKLSFQLITINTVTKTITVRECLWNKLSSSTSKIVWGKSRTISLQ